MYRFSDFRNHNRRTIVIAGEALSISVCHQKSRACLFDNFTDFFKHQTSKNIFDIMNVSSFSKYVGKSYFW